MLCDGAFCFVCVFYVCIVLCECAYVRLWQCCMPCLFVCLENLTVF